jgi:hypothetical protein
VVVGTGHEVIPCLVRWLEYRPLGNGPRGGGFRGPILTGDASGQVGGIIVDETEQG